MSRAKIALSLLPADTIRHIQTKQACHQLLAKEGDLVTQMAKEGLLLGRQADFFLNEISEDMNRLRHKRDHMHK